MVWLSAYLIESCVLYCREEAEKFNVYKGYLNMESMYGSPETLAVVLKKAVECNDAFKVYMEMINIQARASKLDVSTFPLSVFQPQYNILLL